MKRDKMKGLSCWGAPDTGFTQGLCGQHPCPELGKGHKDPPEKMSGAKEPGFLFKADFADFGKTLPLVTLSAFTNNRMNWDRRASVS